MIHYGIPWDTAKDLGGAYNRFLSLLPHGDDYACLLDADACFTTTFYGAALEAITARHPACGFFLATTNRVGCWWQLAEGIDRASDDMAYHREQGRRLLELHGTDCVDASRHQQPASGFLMLLRKRTWERAGKFPPGIIGVDQAFYRAAVAAGEPALLMRGVYLYHWYRGGRPDDASHLR